MRGAQGGRLALALGASAVLTTVMALGSVSSASAAPLKARFKAVPSRAVTKTISTAKGGTLTLHAPGRTRIVVKIPKRALLADTRITATPITGFRVAPVHGGFVAGVKLVPDGLELLKPGSVEFRPRKALRPTRRYFLGSQGNGRGVSLVPPAFRKVGRGRKAKLRVVSKPIVPILHFSTVEAFDWSKANLRDLDAIRYPQSEVDRFRQEIAQMLAVERQRQLLGLEDSLLLEDVFERLGRIRDREIKPRLAVVTAALKSRCSMQAVRNGRDALVLALDFIRQEQLLGRPDSFDTAALMGPILKGIATCMLKQCERYGPRLAHALVVLARQVELIGAPASDAFFATLLEDLVACSKGEVHVDSTIDPSPDTPEQIANETYIMRVVGRASFEATPDGRGWVYKEAPLEYEDAHGSSYILGDVPECGTYFYRDTLRVNADGAFRINQLDFRQLDPSRPDTSSPIVKLSLTITHDPTEYVNVLEDCEEVHSSGVKSLWLSYFGYLHPDNGASSNLRAVSFNGADFVPEAAPVIALATYSNQVDVYYENTLVEVIAQPGPMTPLPEPFGGTDEEG